MFPINKFCENDDHSSFPRLPIWGSTVCFAFTLAQLKKILILGIGKLDGTLVISFRVNISVILENNGITFINAWDLLEKGDIENATRHGNLITESWYRSFVAELTYKSHCIPELDRSCLRFLFQDSVYLKLLFERLTRTIPVRRCVVISSFDQPIEFHPQDSEIHACLIAEFCRQYGIPMVAIPLAAPEQFHFSNRMPKIARSTETIAQRKNIPDRKTNSSADADSHKIGILLDVINDNRDYIRILASMGFSVKGFSLWHDESARAELESIGCKTVPLGISLDKLCAKPHQELFKNVYNKFEKSPDDLFEEYPYIFRNRWLKFQFNHIFLRRWPQLCCFVDQAEKMFSETELDVFITAAYDVPESLILLKEARKNVIPVIAFPHSSNLELCHTWTDVERICVLMKHHIPDDQPDQSTFRVIGSPKHFLKQADGDQKNESQCLRRQMGLPEDKKLVFAVTNSFYESLTPFVNPTETIYWIRAIANIPPGLESQIAIIWKSKKHVDDSSIPTKIAGQSGKQDMNIVLPSSTEFESVASVCDLAVGVNCWTTGFVDIVLNGKLLILTGESAALGAESFYGKFVIPDSSIPQARNSEELWSLMECLLFNEARREELVSKQREELLKSMRLDETPTLIRELILEVIEQNRHFRN